MTKPAEITPQMIEAAARALARNLEGVSKEESWWQRYEYAAQLALEAALNV